MRSSSSWSRAARAASVSTGVAVATGAGSATGRFTGFPWVGAPTTYCAVTAGPPTIFASPCDITRKNVR